MWTFKSQNNQNFGSNYSDHGLHHCRFENPAIKVESEKTMWGDMENSQKEIRRLNIIESMKENNQNVVLIYEWCLSLVVCNREVRHLFYYFVHITHTKQDQSLGLGKKLRLTRTLAHLCNITGIRREGSAQQTSDTCNNNLVQQAMCKSSTCIKAH